MKLVSKIVLVLSILCLLSMVSPVIKESMGNLFASAGSDTNHAISTVAENGGFSDTWDSLTKLVGDVVDEATGNTDK
jgi:hypothetical protein